MRKAQAHWPAASRAAGSRVFGLYCLEMTRQQGGCMGRIVGCCCCAAGQNIWLDFWGDVCVRGVLTLLQYFFTLSLRLTR